MTIDDACPTSSGYTCSTRQQKISILQYMVLLNTCVEVGPSKERLDGADISLNVVEVTESFGKFVKFLVKKQADSRNEVTNPPMVLNAFQMFLSSQGSKTFLEPVNKRNKRDKLKIK